MNQVTRDYAFSFLGVWYKWGGNNRLEGMDCGGFVAEVLRSAGLVPPHQDLNASMLFDRFAKSSPSVPVQYGALLFFGDSERSITHVAIGLNEAQMIEAGGGRQGFDSLADATKGMGAMVRVRAWKDTSRPLVKAVMPPWPK